MDRLTADSHPTDGNLMRLIDKKRHFLKLLNKNTMVDAVERSTQIE